ncbi:MAG: TrmB family transcriptional regulator [Archaeoglobus sp.]|nr:TrmB family transcriptional regulator [Archaeoglobus sp.]
MEKVVENLKLLGMSEYEARVYISLVRLGKATAREVHDDSGVPRARVYDVLDKLAKKGFADVEEAEPKRYKAVEPEKIVEKLRRRYIAAAEESLIELEKLKFSKREEFSPALVMRGEWNIRERIRELVNQSEKEILILSSNPDLILGLENEILEFSRSGGKIICVFDEMDERLRKLREYVELRVIIKDGWLMDGYLQGIIEDGIRFRMEGLFVFDSRRSIVVIEENERKLGVFITLPIIAFMQRGMLESLILERTVPLEFN